MARDQVVRLGRRQILQGSLALAGLSLLAGCGLAPLLGPEPKRAARVGYLDAAFPQVVAPRLEAFRQAMRVEGYEEGQGYVLEARHSEGNLERLPSLAAELVSLPVDVILASNEPAITAARNATATVPIVMTGVGNDPVALGLVASLAQPGANVTGTANLNVTLNGKRVELLKETLPALSRVAVLQDAANVAGNALGSAESELTARALGIQLRLLPLQSANDLEAAFDAATHGQAEALTMGGNAFFQINRVRIVGLAAQHRLPAIYQQREFAEAGGLMSYAANPQVGYRKAATYVSKILKGAKPADLPVEQATQFDLVINLKTAQALGLTIPRSVLQQATEIIQ